MKRLLLTLCLLASPAVSEVRLEHLTTAEVSAALDAGFDTILIPTGGTEQNGAHMVLGKHNLRVAHLSERIAEEVGRALVAPVMAYVPEGRIDPPEGHMRFPGTISLPDEVFALTVEYAARSFYQAGFRHIVLLGDSGGNQRALHDVAQKLNKEWWGDPVLYADAFYRSNAVFVDWLKEQGVEGVNGGHAGLADTALMLAVDPSALRSLDLHHPGTDGDPTHANAQLGDVGLRLFVKRTAAQIRDFRGD